MARLNCILLCIALVYGAKSADAVLPGAVSSIASAAITQGLSWSGNTFNSLKDDGYSITVVLEVQNWSSFNLDLPEVRLYSGAVSKPPPVSVQPAKSEVMVYHKITGSAYGCAGTVSWMLEGLNRRVYVMWSIPNSYVTYSNMLAVGLSREGITYHPSDNQLFSQMHDGQSDANIRFSRGKYSHSASTITYNDDMVEVTGIMGTSYEAEVKITVRPVKEQNLAAPFVALLRQSSGGNDPPVTQSLASNNSNTLSACPLLLFLLAIISF